MSSQPRLFAQVWLHLAAEWRKPSGTGMARNVAPTTPEGLRPSATRIGVAYRSVYCPGTRNFTSDADRAGHRDDAAYIQTLSKCSARWEFNCFCGLKEPQLACIAHGKETR